MKEIPAADRRDRLAGCLLGTAVGDAVGLPRENLSARRAARLFGGGVRHALIPAWVPGAGGAGRGMVSDDAEHAALSALALLEEPTDAGRFAGALARRLRWWAAGLPAGAGKATLTACAKLWCGVPPARSGTNSAGNGPAMRAAILGCYFADDAGRRRRFAEVSARLTHADPRAVAGAQVVARAAALATTDALPADPAAAPRAVCDELDEPELRRALDETAAALAAGDDGPALGARLGWRPGGADGVRRADGPGGAVGVAGGRRTRRAVGRAGGP